MTWLLIQAPLLLRKINFLHVFLLYFLQSLISGIPLDKILWNPSPCPLTLCSFLLSHFFIPVLRIPFHSVFSLLSYSFCYSTFLSHSVSFDFHFFMLSHLLLFLTRICVFSLWCLFISLRIIFIFMLKFAIVSVLGIFQSSDFLSCCWFYSNMQGFQAACLIFMKQKLNL